MLELAEITKLVGGMPVGTLVAVVVLAGFGLAAFAIYAVMVVAKKE
jgi:hypothetical protein